MVGFDAPYRNDYADEEMARIAGREDRIVSTWDMGILERGNVERGYWPRHIDEFRRCEGCRKVYGPESHYGRMREHMERLSGSG